MAKTKRAAKPQVDVEALAAQVNQLTQLVTQLVNKETQSAKPSSKKTTRTPKAKPTKASKGTTRKKGGERAVPRAETPATRRKDETGVQTFAPTPGAGKREARSIPFEVGKHRNNFVDDGKIAAKDSVKLRPELGVHPDTIEPRTRKPIPKIKATCTQCGRTDVVSVSLFHVEQGEMSGYRCDACCRGR